MNVLDFIKMRKSKRRFLKRDIPDEMILNIIEYASNAPSYKNSQPWKVYVIKEPKLSQLSVLLINEFESGKPISAEIKEPIWPDEIQNRIKSHIEMRAKKLGLNIDDKDALKRARLENYRFYNAPVGIFIFCDKSLTEWSVFDLGAFVYGITLAASANGLGSVIQASLVDYPYIIKDFLNVPENLRLIVGLSMGYPDESDIVNSYESQRISVDEFVRIIK